MMWSSVDVGWFTSLFSSVIWLVISYSSRFNSQHSTTLWFSACTPHNKALLCVTSLAGILSLVSHFSSITESASQSKTWKTAEVPGKKYTTCLMCLLCVLTSYVLVQLSRLQFNLYDTLHYNAHDCTDTNGMTCSIYF